MIYISHLRHISILGFQTAMIKVQKSPSPQVLMKHPYVLAYEEACLKGQKPVVSGLWNWFLPLIRDTLVEDYHGKCAFCETKVTPRNDLQVNHYRPRTHYYWLLFEWSNLVPACCGCAHSKSDQFPVAKQRIESPPTQREAWYAGSLEMRSEYPLLLHPEVDDPEAHFVYDERGLIRPRNRSTKAASTIDLCDLNRESLVDRRWTISIAFYNKALNARRGINNSDDFSDLHSMGEPDQEYASFVQFLMRINTINLESLSNQRINRSLQDILPQSEQLIQAPSKRHVLSEESNLAVPIALKRLEVRQYQCIHAIGYYRFTG